ncbi:hypothetical protein U472_10205 [Orenia metallireducens]|uniref:Uncharacterized protein n=1 Tax=Orenia metallireducens TaxID=1413210 RepID=A0A1C0A823_9FIRM|nr:hypothetical protein [Orenia metallireducens]OCL26368.1 hypothetical protein U472_10205 [Orenia metallireducens]
MIELKKVDAFSAAKVYLLTILPLLLFGFLLNLAVMLVEGGINLAEILMTIGQIIFAFIGTFISAKIYNFIADRFGGLKAEVISLDSKLSRGRKTRMIEVKRLDIKSIIKVYGIIAAAISLIFGLFTLLAGLLANDVALVGLGVVSPIIYIVFGVIFSAIVGWLYNFIAVKFGGVKVELEGKIEEDSIV